MSLVSTAFPWTNDDLPNKKRTPAMNRKTVRNQKPADIHPIESQDFMIYDVSEIQEKSDERTNRVTEIINQMSSVSVDNDGSGLADFTPPPNPAVQQKKYLDTNLAMPPANDRQPTQPYTSEKTSAPLGNYREVYTNPPKPYYSAMGLSSHTPSGSDNKLFDKLNYMIHILENMEAEKTANITEEFVLYSFTGIFIIFVLDTFLKTGKYVR